MTNDEIKATTGEVTVCSLRDEFVSGYCARSSISREQFDEMLVALPCDCADETCQGWAAIRRSPGQILHHIGIDLGIQFNRIEHAAESAQSSDWLPIATAPEDDREFLVGGFDEEGKFHQAVSHHENPAVNSERGWNHRNGPLDVRATHWKPLNTPTREEAS